MNQSRLRMLSLVAALLAGCAEPTPTRSSPDAPTDSSTPAIDSPGAVTMLPTWALEDLQPASPRVGQTYGLDVFTQKIIVVSLLEGF